MEDHRDEAEQAEDVVHQDGPIAPDAPEADALEQSAEVHPAEDDEDVVGDAPEADALEQRRAVGDDEGDDERR